MRARLACLLATLMFLFGAAGAGGRSPGKGGRARGADRGSGSRRLAVGGARCFRSPDRFDIDVAKEIAKRLGLPVKFVTPGWDAILAGGWNGKWDYSVSNITPTEARGRSLAFPAVYRFEAVVVVVHKSNRSVTKPADVSGKRIGVKHETTFEQYLMHDLTIYKGDAPPPYLIDNPVIRPYPDKAKALDVLAQGDGGALDAVVTSFSTARAAIDGGAPVRLVPGFLFWEPVAVAIDIGDDAFVQRIDAIVNAMMDDGALNALSLKWFGIDMTAP